MSEAKFTKIEKFVIDIHGKKLELTPDQAKELRDILTEVLGPASTQWDEIKRQLEDAKKDRIVPFPYPQPYPVYPAHPWHWWEPYYVTWQNMSAGNPDVSKPLTTSGTYLITAKAG